MPELPYSLSTPQCILHWVRHTPDAVAVIEVDRPYTYGDLGVGIAQYVKALRATGLQPGMLMGVACANRYLCLLVLFASEIIGATTLSLTRHDVDSGDPVLAHCDLLCIGMEGAVPSDRGGVLHLTQAVIDRIGRTPVGAGDLGLLDHCPDTETVVTLVRTSGSTGRPKVLAMTHGRTMALLERTAWQPSDPGYEWNFLNLYGFSNRSSFQESSIALRAGCTVVSSGLGSMFTDMERFGQFRATLVSGDAVRLAHAVPAGWSGPRTGLIHIKGGALPEAIRDRLRREIVTHVYHNYGANETSRLTIIGDDGVGILLPDVSIRIMTDQGTEALQGEVGLIEAWARGMVDGYRWDEDATRAAFRDGWYRTGDMGFMPGPDRLVVLGRADDWINLGGIKFSPQAIEQRMKEIPGVEDAVLLALPDAAGHDLLHVVLQSHDAGLVDRCRERLIASLSGQVTVFVPHVMTRLPRTETGKVRRPALRRLLAEATSRVAV